MSVIRQKPPAITGVQINSSMLSDPLVNFPGWLVLGINQRLDVDGTTFTEDTEAGTWTMDSPGTSENWVFSDGCWVLTDPSGAMNVLSDNDFNAGFYLDT